jgi:hypothetical protein
MFHRRGAAVEKARSPKALFALLTVRQLVEWERKVRVVEEEASKRLASSGGDEACRILWIKRRSRNLGRSLAEKYLWRFRMGVISSFLL